MTLPVKVIEGAGTNLELASALLFYRSNAGHVYATAHGVQPHPSIPGARIIGPGTAATKESLASFAVAVSDATAYRGMVPENLLYTRPNVIAWWSKARTRRVWFQSTDEAIGKRSAVIGHPALVFVALPRRWFVFAVRETGRPNAGTPLYKAPYFNVWNNGEICTGNVDLPTAISQESIPAFENAFFRSRFTHPNDNRLVRYAGGATALWRDLLQQDEAMIQPGVLLPRKETFEQAITRILTKDQ